MANIPFKFDLGVRIKDRVTGMTGIVTGRNECLNGCLRYSIQPAAEKDKPATLPDSWWVDEGQCELIDKGINNKPVPLKRTGGPSTRIAAPRVK